MKKIFFLLSIILFNTLFSQISKFDIDDKKYHEIISVPFSKIYIYSKINAEIVIVEDSENQKVELSSTDNSVNILDVKVYVDDNKLEIKLPFFSSIKGETVFAKIYTPAYKINEIIASTNSKIISKNLIKSMEDIEINAYTGGTIDLNIEANKLEIKVSTGGKVRLSGKAKEQKVEVSTASHYYGKDLVTERTDIEMILGGDADVFATEILKVDGGSGSVNYYGSPKSKEIKGSSVKEIK